MSLSKVYCYVIGRVQNVMFRQTIMRGALKRGLECGATNNKENTRRVDISLKGNKEKIDEMLDIIKSGKELNSWGAYVDKLTICDHGIDPINHEINTSNVDNFNWNQDIDFYL